MMMMMMVSRDAEATIGLTDDFKGDAGNLSRQPTTGVMAMYISDTTNLQAAVPRTEYLTER